MRVQAYQLIYGNVEAEQSPSRRGGFQTLFYTRSALTETEVSELEARFFHIASQHEWVKRVYFVSKTGRYVVAQVVPIPEPDKLGRLGRSLAHAFILTREAFEQAGCDPFALFHSAPFVSTVEQALQQGNHQTQDIPPVELEVSAIPGNAELAQEWHAEDLKQMALLALHAEQMAQERATVAFIGEPQQVENALQAAMLAVPAPLRHRCTFDTYFLGGNPVATYYWAVGLPEPSSNPNFHPIDARSRRVTSKPPLEPRTLYERWVIAQIDAGTLSVLQNGKEHAFALCEWLEGRSSEMTLVDSAPPSVVEQVFRMAPQQVRTRLVERLEDQLPPPLAQRCGEWLSQHLSATELLRAIRDGISLGELLDTLERAYAALGYRKPREAELEALGPLLQGSYHRRLRLLYLCWTRQTPILQGMLEGMPESEYCETVKFALHHALIEPHHLIVPGKTDAFLDVYSPMAPRDVGKPQWHTLIKALIKHSGGQSLARLKGFIRQVSPEVDIENLLRQTQPTSGTHSDAETQPRSPLDFMRGLFKRHPS